MFGCQPSTEQWEELLPLKKFAYSDMVQCFTCETQLFLNAGFHALSVTDMLLKDILSATVRPWLEQQNTALQIAKDCIPYAGLYPEAKPLRLSIKT